MIGRAIYFAFKVSTDKSPLFWMAYNVGLEFGSYCRQTHIKSINYPIYLSISSSVFYDLNRYWMYDPNDCDPN